MRNLTLTAWIITALGVAMTLLAFIASLDELWLLGGILLALTGVVKIVMLQIWTRLAKLGTDEHEPINAP